MISIPLQVAESRQGLPIIGMEQEIVEMVREHDVVVLCGETGCGKTTQVCLLTLSAQLRLVHACTSLWPTYAALY